MQIWRALRRDRSAGWRSPTTLPALLLMPTRFLDDAQRLRYDIERLERSLQYQFRAGLPSFEYPAAPAQQRCPLLFHQGRHGRQYLQTSKRNQLSFCPARWALPIVEHPCRLLFPVICLPQLAQMPDGKTYLCLGTIYESGGSYLRPQRKFAIGLGGEIDHAQNLSTAPDSIWTIRTRSEHIGVSCRVQPPDCSRALSAAIETAADRRKSAQPLPLCIRRF